MFSNLQKTIGLKDAVIQYGPRWIGRTSVSTASSSGQPYGHLHHLWFRRGTVSNCSESTHLPKIDRQRCSCPSLSVFSVKKVGMCRGLGVPSQSKGSPPAFRACGGRGHKYWPHSLRLQGRCTATRGRYNYRLP
jgi:hypothetical protein